MRHTDFKHLLKTALLLTTAILVIGNTAALQWESPDSGGQVIGSEYTLNVSDTSNSDYNVIFYYSNQGEDNFQEFGEDTQSETYDGTNYWTAELSDPGSGSYTIRANLTNGTTSEIEEIDLTKDQGGPDVSLQDSDLEFVGDDPTISVVAEDDYSNIDSLTAFADYTEVLSEDERDCSSGNKCIKDFDLDTESLDSGESITLNLEATDQVGNPGSNDPTLTFDNSFEADTPEFSVDGNEDGVVELDEDVNVDVTVDNIDEETSDEIRVKCLVDGDEVGSTDWSDADDSDFSCGIEMDEVDDETVDVSVEVCDQAGNCEESDEEEITFDASDPILESFSTVQNYHVFGDDFDVEYEASDSATDIESAEYFFSNAVIPGEGNEVDAGQQEFKVETSLLPSDSNQHTVYMRVQDEAGRWSDYQGVDFEYYPNADPSVSLSVPENFSVKAGNSKGFDVIVENTGKLMVGEINVSFSSEFMEDEKTIEDIEGGESRSVEFLIEPTDDQIGEWSVEASTDGPVASESTNILIEANSNQRDTVDSKLENYSALLDTLNSNISTLKEGGLNSDLEESLNSGVSSFEQTVQAAQGYVEQGDYYRAYSTLENVETQYSEAEQTFSKVNKKHRINERNSTILMVLAGLALVLVAAGAYVYTREEYEVFENLGEGEYKLPELGGFGEKMSEKVDGFKEFLKKEEEEVEDAFQGFQ